MRLLLTARVVEWRGAYGANRRCFQICFQKKRASGNFVWRAVRNGGGVPGFRQLKNDGLNLNEEAQLSGADFLGELESELDASPPREGVHRSTRRARVARSSPNVTGRPRTNRAAANRPRGAQSRSARPRRDPLRGVHVI